MSPLDCVALALCFLSIYMLTKGRSAESIAASTASTALSKLALDRRRREMAGTE